MFVPAWRKDVDTYRQRDNAIFSLKSDRVACYTQGLVRGEPNVCETKTGRLTPGTTEVLASAVRPASSKKAYWGKASCSTVVVTLRPAGRVLPCPSATSAVSNPWLARADRRSREYHRGIHH